MPELYVWSEASWYLSNWDLDVHTAPFSDSACNFIKDMTELMYLQLLTYPPLQRNKFLLIIALTSIFQGICIRILLLSYVLTLKKVEWIHVSWRLLGLYRSITMMLTFWASDPLILQLLLFPAAWETFKF